MSKPPSKSKQEGENQPLEDPFHEEERRRVDKETNDDELAVEYTATVLYNSLQFLKAVRKRHTDYEEYVELVGRENVRLFEFAYKFGMDSNELEKKIDATRNFLADIGVDFWLRDIICALIIEAEIKPQSTRLSLQKYMKDVLDEVFKDRHPPPYARANVVAADDDDNKNFSSDALLFVTPELPTVAPHLWEQRDLSKGQSAPAFLMEHYSSWIGKGLTKGHIHSLDPALYKELDNFFRNNKKGKKPIPDGFSLPSVAEENSNWVHRVTAAWGRRPTLSDAQEVERRGGVLRRWIKEQGRQQERS